jgi:hypothetical protein
MNLPISSFADKQELDRCFDRITYQKENAELYGARMLAESYYEQNNKKMGDWLLKVAGDAFLMKQQERMII